MSDKADTIFRKRCEKVAEMTGVDVMFFEDGAIVGGHKPDAYEDDGSLHIETESGLRACFDVNPGQDLPGVDQNARTRKVMEALGMKRKITDRVLVDDSLDDVEERCPTCGRLN